MTMGSNRIPREGPGGGPSLSESALMLRAHASSLKPASAQDDAYILQRKWQL